VAEVARSKRAEHARTESAQSRSAPGAASPGEPEPLTWFVTERGARRVFLLALANEHYQRARALIDQAAEFAH
jgi:hypothetical protein